MFCTKCGAANPDGTNFCEKCGTKLAQSVGAPPPGGPPAGDSAPPPQGVPNQGFQPPAMGYGPPNTGFNPTRGYQVPPGAYPPKKKSGGLIAAVIILVLVVILVPVIIFSTINSQRNPPVLTTPHPASSPNDTDISSAKPSPSTTAPKPSAAVSADGMRENYTQILGDGKDKVTVMVYICGADLESDNGCATLDINEMLKANLGSNVNVVLETGGCTAWSTPGIRDGEVQRWVLQNGKLKELQKLGETPMLSSGQLGDFISFASQKYPANRYDLVLWDHGGGSVYGYGSDEVYPKTAMYLPNIAQALKGSGLKFDFVGFDACLMGSVETAYMLEPYADYLIGSEELEPAFGWDYTPWLNALGKNPSIDTVALGKVLVDGFMEQNAPTGEESDSGDNTLSVVSLREIPGVYDALDAYMKNATGSLGNSQKFKALSSAVSHTKAFAEGDDLDMIDLGDFAAKAGLDGKAELTKALDSAVKYSQSTAKKGVNGLSFYFPYRNLQDYADAKKRFADFGFGGDIYKFYDKFATYLAGGQKNSNSRSLKENFTGQQDAQTDYSNFSWYSSSDVQSYTYDNIDYTELKIQQDKTTGDWYLPLTEDEWSLITDVQQQILLDDGEGYIDLGSDQYYEKDNSGNLLLAYGKDRTWVAIGGQTVCYYAESTTTLDDGTNVFTGYVPAVLNGKTDIDIILEYDGEQSDGAIVGYRLTGADAAGNGTIGKGYKQFKKGDKIDFVCDYYTYDGKYDDQYYIGESLTIGDKLPAVSYESVGKGRVLECYMLVDVYQNKSWTETVEFPAEK